jgi:hypothetical protein
MSVGETVRAQSLGGREIENKLEFGRLIDFSPFSATYLNSR